MFNEILLSSFIGAYKTFTHLGLVFDPNALMFEKLMVHNYASKEGKQGSVRLVRNKRSRS